MTNNYPLWNDMSVTHLFVRLITKTNHPYNENLLTEEEFNNDYKNLIGYIQWRESYHIPSSLYDFTDDKMKQLISMINWEKENKEELTTIWTKLVEKEWK